MQQRFMVFQKMYSIEAASDKRDTFFFSLDRLRDLNEEHQYHKCKSKADKVNYKHRFHPAESYQYASESRCQDADHRT